MSQRVALLLLLLIGLSAPPVIYLAVQQGGERQVVSSPASGVAPGGFHPVAGGFKPDDTEIADCGQDTLCYEQALGNVAFKDGPKPALKQFARLIEANPVVSVGCHRMAHMIGSAALARYEDNVPRAFAEGDSTCWSGYYHGILERAFLGTSSKAEMGEKAQGICEDADMRKDLWITYQCVHGLGHGLMIRSGYAVPTALEICDLLKTEWDQLSCYGGVFMENISTSYGTKSPWLKDGDLVYPCASVEDKYRQSCYLMVTSRILQANGYDWQETIALCRTQGEPWRDTCFQSLGRDASGSTQQTPAKINELCRLTADAPADEAACFDGAARDVAANYSSAERGREVCVLAPGASKPRCYWGLGVMVGTFNASLEGRVAGCEAVTPAPYLRDCLKGANADA